MNPNFSWFWNISKGAVSGLGGGAVGLLLAWAIRGWNGGDFSLSPEETAAFALVVGWIVAQGKNLIKQNSVTVKKLVPVLLCVAMLQGGY